MEIRRLRTALLAGSSLALLATAPALAQQKDCAQRLDQIEEHLAQSEVDPQRQSDIDQVVRGARQLAETGDEQGCMNVVAELDDLMTTLKEAGQPQTTQGSEQGQARQQQGQATPQTSQSGQEVGEADMESLQSGDQQAQAQPKAQAGSNQPQAADQQQTGAQQPPMGEQKQAQTGSDEQPTGNKGPQEMAPTGAEPPQAGEEQAQGQAEVTARVAIEQPQPQVVVRQKPPKIMVHIPKPVITVRLPQPEVHVQMPDPDVQVEQADPDIQVVMGQPDVQLQDSGTQGKEAQQPVKADVQFEREQHQQAEIDVQMEDPEVRVEQEEANVQVAERAPGAEQQQLTEGHQETDRGNSEAPWSKTERPGQPMTTAGVEPARTPTGQPAMEQEKAEQEKTPAEIDQKPQREPAQATADNPLAAMPASDVIGAEVKNQDGDTVAEIVDLVKHQGQDDLFAVLSVGGFLGIGDKKVVVPVNELEVSQNGEIVMVNASEDQLKQMPEYQEEGYESTAQLEQAPAQQQ